MYCAPTSQIFGYDNLKNRKCRSASTIAAIGRLGGDDAFVGLLDAETGDVLGGWQFGGEGFERVYALGFDGGSGDVIVGGFTTGSLFAANGEMVAVCWFVAILDVVVVGVVVDVVVLVVSAAAVAAVAAVAAAAAPPIPPSCDPCCSKRGTTGSSCLSAINRLLILRPYTSRPHSLSPCLSLAAIENSVSQYFVARLDVGQLLLSASGLLDLSEGASGGAVVWGWQYSAFSTLPEVRTD